MAVLDRFRLDRRAVVIAGAILLWVRFRSRRTGSAVPVRSAHHTWRRSGPGGGPRRRILSLPPYRKKPDTALVRCPRRGRRVQPRVHPGI